MRNNYVLLIEKKTGNDNKSNNDESCKNKKKCITTCEIIITFFCRGKIKYSNIK